MSIEDAGVLLPSLWKISATAANRLIESTVARYRVELADIVPGRIKSLLDEAKYDEESKRWRVELPTGVIKNSVIDNLRRLNQPNPKPSDIGEIWEFATETFNALRKEYGLAEKLAPRTKTR